MKPALFEAKLLADHLRAQGHEDDQLLLDTIEGETEALAVVDHILSQISEAEQHQAVLKLREEELSARRQRYSTRTEALRAALLAWMGDVGLTRLERPEATLSVSSGRPGVVYTADFGAELPDEYVTISRTPNKAAVRKAVLAGASIVGAELSNSPPSLVIRRS